MRDVVRSIILEISQCRSIGRSKIGSVVVSVYFLAKEIENRKRDEAVGELSSG